MHPLTAKARIDLSDVQRSWKWFLVLGVVLVVLGIVSLSASPFWTVASVRVLGGLFVVAGLLTVIHGLWQKQSIHLCLGVTYAVLGNAIVKNPETTGVTVNFVLAVALLLVGIGRLVAGLARRSYNRAWLVLNGVTTFLLGLLLWREWGWVLTFLTLSFARVAGLDTASLGPGDYTRSLAMGQQTRSYLVHVPKGYDPTQPTPVVLALHGASMNGPLMAVFCGLNQKADQEGFLVVYPNGTGNGYCRFWDTSGLRDGDEDDVTFIRKVLDDLETVVTVDKRRVYACGMSDGGTMCYRLAAELSERIAAVAPVAGGIPTPESGRQRPVPLIHFHGTADAIIPFQGRIEGSIQTWAKRYGCPETQATDQLTKSDDELRVTRTTNGPGTDGAQVVLVVIEGGGHTWPGQKPLVSFLGQSSRNISANDLLWEFFQKHPMRE